MATFNGTQVADTISGTNDADIITGLAGNDTINGADGNDTITGGVGDDNILGGAGDDLIVLGDDEEGSGTQVIDGGDDNDTVQIADLDDGDALLNGAATIGGVGNTVSNVEFFQIGNASDFILTVGEDAVFAMDQTLTSDQSAGTASGATGIEGATFTSGTIDFDGVAFDEAEGIVINGTTYAAGDTYTTAAGGEVAITFASNEWNLNYTAAPQSNIELGETAEDEVLAIQATQATTGAVIDIAVTLDMSAGANINLNTLGVTADTRVVAAAAGSTITDGAGSDVLVGGAAGDTFTIQSDADNAIWAGAADNAADTINITGNGNNTAAGGADNDNFNVGGNGANTLFGGTGADTFTFTDAEGNNTAWGGSDTGIDTFSLDADTDGNNVLGGGEGADVFTVAGDGNNTLYLGADDDRDSVTISGNGDNTVFGGANGDGSGANSNQITISGTGANTIFNGAGDDDAVSLTAAATGDNVLYGGAGDDTFTFAVGAVGTLILETGNGSDSLTGLELDGKVSVDLSALGFADANDVLANMTDGTNGVELFVTAGQVITLENNAGNLTVSDLQAADPADWLIL